MTRPQVHDGQAGRSSHPTGAPTSHHPPTHRDMTGVAASKPVASLSIGSAKLQLELSSEVRWDLALAALSGGTVREELGIPTPRHNRSLVEQASWGSGWWFPERASPQSARLPRR